MIQSTTRPGQLIQTGNLDGPMNMAVDELLWDEAAGGTPFLRIYGWAEPTLSLGYFQSYHPQWRVADWNAVPFVRRLTGGGAILHHYDLTYSLALPAALAPRTDDLYERFHRAVAAALGALGVPAAVSLNPSPPTPLPQGARGVEKNPLPQGERGRGEGSAARSADGATDMLCFHRNDRFAVRVGDAKILGSAQRRRRTSVLMHGSLLLATSPLGPDLPGLTELTGRPIGRAALEQAIVRAAQACLTITFGSAILPEDLQRRATQLANDKYRSAAWNERR